MALLKTILIYAVIITLFCVGIYCEGVRLGYIQPPKRVHVTQQKKIAAQFQRQITDLQKKIKEAPTLTEEDRLRKKVLEKELEIKLFEFELSVKVRPKGPMNLIFGR